LLLCTKFHQNRFTCLAYRRPKLLNVQCAVARQLPFSWQPQHGGVGGHVGNVMGCDHLSFVQISPLIGELWHFQYFPMRLPSAILILKVSILDHVTVIEVLICCCVPNFWSAIVTTSILYKCKKLWFIHELTPNGASHIENCKNYKKVITHQHIA